MLDWDGVIRFLDRAGPFLVTYALVVVGMFFVGRVYKFYRDGGQERIGLYVAVILQHWVILTAVLGFAFWARVIVGGQTVDASLREFGLISSIEPNHALLWAGWLVLLWLGIGWAYSAVHEALGLKYTRTRILMHPRTTGETFVWSLLVSPTAGICEEILFRGYMVSYLMRSNEEGFAIFVSAVAFGAVHFSQGLLAVLVTGLMGATAAWSFVVTGSIWPAILAHTVYNMGVPFLFRAPGDEAQNPA